MTELAREYGDGLYILSCEDGNSQEILEQMQSLKDLFHDQPDFIRLLSNMSISKTERVGIIDEALREQIHPYLLNFLKILCEKCALNEFGGCLEAFSERYHHDNNVVEAVVTTAVELNETQRTELLEKLRKMTGKTVHLNEKIDASLIGGVLLEMDGKQYDNTLKKRLKDLHQAIAQDA